MKAIFLLLLGLVFLLGCATKETKVVVYKNDRGEYVMPEETGKKGIFYEKSDFPGAMDPTNSMSPDTLRARENGMDQASQRAGR